MRPLGLTRAQWMFLFQLSHQPGATQSELAEHLQMEKISVSRQAGRLQRAGWIERRDDSADRRAYRNFFSTPRATRVVGKLDHMAQWPARGLPPRGTVGAALGAGGGPYPHQDQPARTRRTLKRFSR